MLIRRDALDGIAAGTVTLQFRRWTRPTVRAGGRLRTAVGELAIEAVDVVDEAAVTDDEIAAAGLASRNELADLLARRADGAVHRVRLRRAGPDPRVALREQSDLDEATVGELRDRLRRMDERTADGPWTTATLRLVEAHPGRRAPDLAAELDRETAAFKTRVRRLKELGLTESLDVGYRLSPRGAALLPHL